MGATSCLPFPSSSDSFRVIFLEARVCRDTWALVMFAGAICYLCCMLTKVQRAPINVCIPAWLLRWFFFFFRNNKQGGGGHAFPISTVKMRLFEGKPDQWTQEGRNFSRVGQKIKTQRNLDQVQVERSGFFSRSVFISLYFINCVAAVLNQFWGTDWKP